jgi:hypothetical protein
MYNLLNKILSRFNLKLVSTKPDTRLVKETVKFLNTIPPEDFHNENLLSPYVGGINYFEDKNGKTYVLQRGTEDKYYDYGGDTFTSQQLQEKLNND